MKNPRRSAPFVLRKEQIEALAREREQRFVRRMCEELPRHWPDVCRAFGGEGLRRLVQGGLERARGYGITTQRGVLRFLNLTLALGEGFDTDPRYPWAVAILDQRGVSETVRVRQLCDRALEVLD